MSDEPAYIDLEHLKRVNLEPGDVLVVQVPGDLSGMQASRLKDSVRAAFPGHGAVILMGGAQLGVLRPVPDGAPDNSPEVVVERYRAAIDERQITNAIEEVMRYRADDGLGRG